MTYQALDNTYDSRADKAGFDTTTRTRELFGCKRKESEQSLDDAKTTHFRMENSWRT